MKYFIALFTITLVLSISIIEKPLNSSKIVDTQNHPKNLVTNSTKTNYPLLVWSSATQPNDSVSSPALFYSPHQDDETIGMGASIAEHVRTGRPVYVILLTNGANTEMLAYLQSLNSNATMKDVTNARNNEFIAACKALGVHRIYISNAGNGYDEAVPFVKLKDEFKFTMSYMKDLFPNASHKTISGNCDSYGANSDKMPTHQAAANAIHELYNSRVITDIKLYRVYYYYNDHGADYRSPSWLKSVAFKDKLTRQVAINQYKYVNPSFQRYGLGYWHSVMSLFDNSWDSDYEFVDFIENDY